MERVWPIAGTVPIPPAGGSMLAFGDVVVAWLGAAERNGAA
jgi:hypothetical protein